MNQSITPVPSPVSVEEVILALFSLGGEANRQAIIQCVIDNRGDGPFGKYRTIKSYRNTVAQQIEQHCTQYAKYNGTEYFEKVWNLATRFRLNGRGVKRMLKEIELGSITSGSQTIYPDEVVGGASHIEGLKKRVHVNRYERDLVARRKCLHHYGPRCQVCDTNFRDFYGPIGEDFIHVHHLVPLSSISTEYVVDPIRDLRPVCPNCHAMLHRNKPPFSIETLKTMIKINQAR